MRQHALDACSSRPFLLRSPTFNSYILVPREMALVCHGMHAPSTKRRRLNVQANLHPSINDLSSSMSHSDSSPSEALRENRVPPNTPTCSPAIQHGDTIMASSATVDLAKKAHLDVFSPLEAACNFCGRRARSLLVTRSPMQMITCARCALLQGPYSRVLLVLLSGAKQRAARSVPGHVMVALSLGYSQQ